MEKCRICWLQQNETKSLYEEVRKDEEDGNIAKYLPKVIEAISGVKITVKCEPLAAICGDCTDAILQAEVTIRKCRESSKLVEQVKCIRKRKNAKIKDFPKEKVKEELETETEHTNEEITEYMELEEPEDHIRTETNLDQEHENDVNRKKKHSGKRKIKKTSLIIKEDNKTDTQNTRKLRKCRKRDTHDVEKVAKDALDQDEGANNVHPNTTESHTVQYDNDTNLSSSTQDKTQTRKYVRTVNKNKDYHFSCDQCAYTTDFATYFRTHLQQTHGIVQPRIFRCSQCPRDFLEYRYQQAHIAHDHQQQPRRRKYLCAECGRAFAKSSNLVYHQRTHLPKDEREATPQVRCDYCSKEYSQHSLRMHILTVHAAKRPHACTRCPAAFAVAKSLQAHMRSCHPVAVHRCPCCEVQFRVRSVYEAHVKRGGCQKLGFNCDFCAWGFKTRERLEKHRLNVHKNLLQAESGASGTARGVSVVQTNKET